ncbi:hypothetical protein AVDCRST_MAG84-2536 [uncultured Microcoleus sp.]|uniref:Uncharacterized protein n=1 Tax=uncultured Microcoleus sp. TaxID=259945 RepID=A0A6J4M1V6_9CYAN|nr:hypothetical protein AVDCRST_MAG84-2536 [uncultured Microcoleus sp.]
MTVKIKFCFHQKAPLSATVPQNYSTNNVKARTKFIKIGWARRAVP